MGDASNLLLKVVSNVVYYSADGSVISLSWRVDWVMNHPG